MINFRIVSTRSNSAEDIMVFQIGKINQPLDVEFRIRLRNLESGIRKIISIFRRGISIISSKVCIYVMWLIMYT